MSSNDVAIQVKQLSKSYQLYQQPKDRLKQFVMPSLQRILGLPQKAYYHEFWALHDVSFEVKRGETIGIVGRNGSGKSTLLQLISGTLAPTHGNVAVNGRVAALLELGSGFNPEFTGRENVYMNGAILGLSQQEIDAKFDYIAAFADIGEFIDQPVKNYSSGMVVRLAFAVQSCVNPEILIVDEALSVGDEAFQRKCFVRIREIQDNGGTILLVSHSATTVIEFCNTAMLLDGGQLIALGAPKQVIGQYHRLIYAPPERQVMIRDQISAEFQATLGSNGATAAIAEPPAITDTSSAPPQTGIVEPSTATLKKNREPVLNGTLNHEMAPNRVSDRFEATYISDMVPNTQITYESGKAQIYDPKILTLDGRQVNLLIQNEEYVYTYSVKFLTDVYNVNFGMLIKTITGVEIGGTTVCKLENGIPHIPQDGVVNVRFRFKCQMLPGVYYLNAGVIVLEVGEFNYIARHIDIAMFKVYPDSESPATGMVDLGIRGEVVNHEPLGDSF